MDFCRQNIVPTKDQESALNLLDEFFNSDQKVFILKGYAGTGKTTITKALANYCKSKSLQPIFMAPTGRAARIITEKTKYPATTIHKAIYDMSELDEVEIKKDKKVQYKFRYKLRDYDQSITNVFFVDEASMVSDKFAEDDFFIFGSGILLKDLIEFIAPNNLARKDRLIFIGDPAQLPPVGQEHSFALDYNYLFEKYGIKADEYQLTEVVRQAENSGILQNATALRKLIELSGRQSFTISNNITDMIETEESTMLETFKLINPNFNINDGIMLVAKNKTALEHNLKIREHSFGATTDIKTGETFLINQNNYNYEVELLNGTLVKILSAENTTITKSNMPSYDAEGNECSVSHRFRWVTIEVPVEDGKNHEIKCMILDNFLFSPERALSYEENIALYIDFKIRNPDLKPKTSAFAKAFKADPYVNALKVKFGYAITVHKAQGGEWNNAIIDMDHYQSYSCKEFLRWAYTAFTRSSEKIYYFNYKNSIYSKLNYHDDRLTSENPTSSNVGNLNVSLKLDEKNTKFIASFLTGEKDFLIEKYHVILSQLKGSTIEVLSRKKLQFAEEYTFSKNNNNITLLFYYNGKDKFTRILEKNKLIKDEDFTSELTTLLSKAVTFVIEQDAPAVSMNIENTSIKNIDIDFPEIYKPLKKLYSDLSELLNENEILITDIEHNNYLEKYHFARKKEKAVINFWYDGIMHFTSAIPQLQECNSNELLGEIAEALNGIKG
jgi:hypothetical protein